MVKPNASSKFTTANHKPSAVTTYPCLDCGRLLSSRYSLKRHMDMHIGKREYTCSWTGCGKSFGQMSNLRIHYRIHTGERPYSCTQCHKSFSSGSALSHHAKTHATGIIRPRRGRPTTKSSKSILAERGSPEGSEVSVDSMDSFLSFCPSIVSTSSSAFDSPEARDTPELPAVSTPTPFPQFDALPISADFSMCPADISTNSVGPWDIMQNTFPNELSFSQVVPMGSSFLHDYSPMLPEYLPASCDLLSGHPFEKNSHSLDICTAYYLPLSSQ